jgi:hypothetical protein
LRNLYTFCNPALEAKSNSDYAEFLFSLTQNNPEEKFVGKEN